MNEAVITCQNLEKTYIDGKNQITVLQKINLTLMKGECIAIMGRSGAGKSTLLHCLGGLDEPTSGDVMINQESIHQTSEKKRSLLRNKYLGFIYQFHHLLPEFTALENVAMPNLIAKIPAEIAFNKARELLTEVGLGERLTHKPGELSGGERQRVAVARALANLPLCILADEPTGNLDNQTADQVFDALMVLNQRYQTSLIIATHDYSLAQRMDKIYRLEHGQLTLVSGNKVP